MEEMWRGGGGGGVGGGGKHNKKDYIWVVVTAAADVTADFRSAIVVWQCCKYRCNGFGDRIQIYYKILR